MKPAIPALLIATMLAAGCATPPPNVTGTRTQSPTSQLQTRQFQTRHYETLDKKLTLRSVIATLQDLGFVIDDADLSLGLVTATRLHKYAMRMTVTVVESGRERISVRANARMGQDSVTNPSTYQDFFVALDKAMFLTLNKVD